MFPGLPEDSRIGTIGMPMCGITAGIAEDGELVVKGPLVCRGYHNNPEVTTQQIVHRANRRLTDGWLHNAREWSDIEQKGGFICRLPAACKSTTPSSEPPAARTCRRFSGPDGLPP